MKGLKRNYCILANRIIYFLFVLIVQVCAVVLKSVNDFLILINIMNGLNCILMISFAYSIFKTIKYRDICFLQICIECMGAFLTFILYRVSLNRVYGEVPAMFIMMPYIVGFFVSVVFRLLIDGGYFNRHIKKKIGIAFRFILFFSACLFGASAFYFAFFLRNSFFAIWSLLTGILLFYVFMSLKRKENK